MPQRSLDSLGPCVKGTALDSVLQDVRALRDSGEIGPEHLEAHLEAEDLRHLDGKISATSWYSVEIYTRLLQLLCDVEAKGNPEAYLFRRGVIAADRLHDSGLYPMLETDCERLGLRALRLFTTIAQALYNFMEWRAEVDEVRRRFTIFVEEAEHYSDIARTVAEGFLSRGAERVTNKPVEVRSERLDRDRVIFHFTIGK